MGETIWLVRVVGGKFPLKHLGPVVGGKFWALKGANDLSTVNGGVAIADAIQLLRRGRLWVQNISSPGNWQEIRETSQIPEFTSEYSEDYDSGMSSLSCSPYVPEFYYLPLTLNGKRIVERAERRAQKRTWEQNCDLLHG